MAIMRVVGVKLTDDPTSTKIAYTKCGNLFVRSGSDGFRTGSPMQGASDHLFSRFGYKKVDKGPEFRDAKEMSENAHRFYLGKNGVAMYS